MRRLPGEGAVNKPPLRPTHRIKALDQRMKSSNKSKAARSSEIGVGWANTDGSMTIRLNVGVSLRWDDEIVITAFPAGDKGPPGDLHDDASKEIADV